MKFTNYPVNFIKAKGWTAEYLDRQNNGITGNIKKCGEPFDCETSVWATKEEIENWYPYEQHAYWIDGALRCSYESSNEELLSNIKNIIYTSLNIAKDRNGYIGPLNFKLPKENATEKALKYYHWPQAVYFRALMAEYEVNGDKKILDALISHYKNTPLLYSGRNACNIECLAWIYKLTNDSFFKDKAVEIFENYQTDTEPELTYKNLTDDIPFNIHGVTICETLKLYPIMYDITGDKKYLNMGIAGLDKLIEQSLMVDGVISSEEYVSGNTAIMAHETCDIADFTWALDYFFNATGNTKYLDIIERMCLNAAPAVVMPDFTALQYFSSPNQVIAKENSTHCRYTKGSNTMSYLPYGNAACCIGNVNRIMPNYINKLWHKNNIGDIYATLYGPCEYNDGELSITEETQYPFDFKIIFTVQAKHQTKRKISFRIPAWADSFTIDTDAKYTEEHGFICIEKEWNGKETITLTFSAKPILKNSSEGGAFVDYGPLLFAFDIKKTDETFISPRHKATFLSHHMYPTGNWNYALRKDLIQKSEISVTKNENQGYVWENPKLTIKLPAIKIKNWETQKTNSVERYVYSPDDSVINSCFVYKTISGDFEMTPPIPDNKTAKENAYGETEEIILIPYGLTKLRISVFPVIE